MSESTEVLSRAEAEEAIDTTAITQYAQESGVSESLARYRLATQTMVPGLEGMIKRTIGSAFSQLWFDNSTGQWVVADTDASTYTAVGELFQSVGLSGEYHVDSARLDATELMSAYGIVSSAVTAALPGGRSTAGIGEGDILVSLAAGEPMGIAEAAVAGVLPDAGSLVKFQATVKPSLLQSPEHEISCEFPFCQELVGGVEWYYHNTLVDGELYKCSTGFEVISSGDPYPLILTAGHCVIADGDYNEWKTCYPGDGEVGIDCGAYGHQIPYYYYGNGGGDAGLLEDDSFPIAPYTEFWDKPKVIAVKSYETAPPSVGLHVCLNGSSISSQTGTGTTCGRVYESAATEHYAAGDGEPEEEVRQMIVVQNACPHPGDSGAAVTTANGLVAVGTHSAGSGTGACETDQESIEEPIWREVEQFGVTIASP